MDSLSTRTGLSGSKFSVDLEVVIHFRQAFPLDVIIAFIASIPGDIESHPGRTASDFKLFISIYQLVEHAPSLEFLTFPPAYSHELQDIPIHGLA